MGRLMLEKIVFIAMSYVVGAIPFGYLIVKLFYKTDIRQHGSGNPGATNVWRTFGKKPGAVTLAFDILKGVVPVLAARRFFPDQSGMALACGMSAIIGHNWSLFLRGKGGKGVATSIGVFLALIPFPSLIAVAVFLAVFFTTGHVSTGSMAGSAGLVAGTFIWETPWSIRAVVILAGLMILIKHVPNIKRLADGTEPKVKFR
jgi:glycerol-3-phosphate acyltransferase PlsY